MCILHLRHCDEGECDSDWSCDSSLPASVRVDDAPVPVPGDGHDGQRRHEDGRRLARLGQAAEDIATILEPQASVENLGKQ